MMNFDVDHPLGEAATHPMARQGGRLALWLRRNSPGVREIIPGSFLLLLAGPGLRRRRVWALRSR